MTNDERIRLACSELTNLATMMLKQSMENMIGLFSGSEPFQDKSRDNTSGRLLNESPDKPSQNGNPENQIKSENPNDGQDEDFIVFDDCDNYFDEDSIDDDDCRNTSPKDGLENEIPEIIEDGFYEDIYGENPFTDTDHGKNSSNTDQKNRDINPDTPLEDLGLSVRAYNCLTRAGISTIGALLGLSYEKMINIRNLGKKCINEINEKILKIYDEIKKSGDSKTACREEQKYQEIRPKYIDKLNELIGLEEVKEQVKKINAFVKMKHDMPENSDVPMVLNMEFVGNPGTAKTTIARIMAGLLFEAGILKSDEIVEVGRSGLVAKYVGQTAVQVKSVFDRAEGKLLFIDEAYSLVESTEGDFGDEAINTIVQEMENRRDKTIVVFAGYPDKMETFFDRNPGLRSRVPFKICFKDYSAEEMYKISEIEACRRGFAISSGAAEKLIGMYKDTALNPNMGNGRYCRNMVESAILNFAMRKYGEDSEDRQKNTEHQKTDFILEAEDFSNVLGNEQTHTSAPIGFRG
ncbi:MAG: AAA family ATPase [Lachnospiraceae bacterium]|nr:AAA family ATPase [Lachnospiraceae bacterium]